MAVLSISDPWEQVQEQPVPLSSVVPHNRGAEEAVLGAVLISPEAYFEVSQFLVMGDFYIQRNRWIWDAYTNLHAKHIPIDMLTISEYLDQCGVLAEIGGSAYITSLINQVPTSLNIESYGRIVQDNAVRRRMIQAANQIATLAYRGGDVLVNFAEGRKAYESSMPTQGEFRTIRELASANYDRIDRIANGQNEEVLSTGFIDMDNILDGGLRSGDLLYLGGRPGMGKTALLLDILLSIAADKKHVAIFSLEMSNEQVTQRIIAKRGISMKSLRTGALQQNEWPIYTHAVEELSDMNIYMDDLPALSPTQLRSKAHALYNRVGLDALIVDYIGLMGGDGRAENRNMEISAISRSLKVTARELKIPVLCAAQLNRKVEERADKHPMLSDLRDSGSLEQDADIIMFAYRDDVYNQKDKTNIAEINIAKQRNGNTGSVELVFRGALMKFENAATRIFKPNQEAQSWQERADMGDD